MNLSSPQRDVRSTTGRPSSTSTRPPAGAPAHLRHPRPSSPSKIVAAVAVASLFLGVRGADARDEPKHRLTSIGGPSSFVSSPLESETELRELFREEREIYEEVLRRAGWKGDADDLFEAIAEGPIEDEPFPVGDRLHWMAFRPGEDSAGVLEDVEWAGDGPLAAYRIRFPSAGREWELVIPKACGNLALLGSSPLGELTLRLSSGAIDLVGPDGEPFRVRAGEDVRIPAAAIEGEERGEPGRRASLSVEEGRVELADPNDLVQLVVEEGEAAVIGLDENRGLELEIPETNLRPLGVRIGDATGTVAPGTGAVVDWSAPECALEVRSASTCAPGVVEIDASASSIRHGALRSVELELFGPDELRESTTLRAPEPFVHEQEVSRPGTYRATAVAVSERGRRSTTCEAPFEVPSCRPDPPICSILTQSPRVEPFDLVQIVGSGSRSRGGTVERLELEVLDEAGAVIEKRSIGRPFWTRWSFAGGGERRIRAVAIDDHGQRSTNPCETTVEVLPRISLAAQLGLGFRRDAARSDQTDGLGSVGVGLMAALGRDLELSVTGEAFGTEAGGDDVVLAANVALDRRLGSAFVGLGLGAWDLDGDADPTVSLRTGAELPRLGGTRPAQLHVEWRFPTDDFDGLDRFVVTGGIRFFVP